MCRWSVGRWRRHAGPITNAGMPSRKLAEGGVPRPRGRSTPPIVAHHDIIGRRRESRARESGLGLFVRGARKRAGTAAASAVAMEEEDGSELLAAMRADAA